MKFYPEWQLSFLSTDGKQTFCMPFNVQCGKFLNHMKIYPFIWLNCSCFFHYWFFRRQRGQFLWSQQTSGAFVSLCIPTLLNLTAVIVSAWFEISLLNQCHIAVCMLKYNLLPLSFLHSSPWKTLQSAVKPLNSVFWDKKINWAKVLIQLFYLKINLPSLTRPPHF